MTRLDVAALVALVRLVALLSVATLLVAPASAAEPGSMLLVWENASPELPALYASGKMPPTPVRF